MPRLPTPGSDNDAWGDILNEFLTQEHNTDGTLKDAVRNNDPRLTNNRTPSDSSITDSKVATGANIDPSKIAGTAVVVSDLRILTTDQSAALNNPTSGTSLSSSNVLVDANDVRIKATVYPESYGAKGDGTTDDTTAIQAAITAVSTSGGFVQFAAKTYILNSTLTLPPAVTFVGQGSDATKLEWPNDLGSGVFAIASTAVEGAINIRDIQLKGPTLTSTPGEIPANMYGCYAGTGSVLDGVESYGFYCGFFAIGNHLKFQNGGSNGNYYGIYIAGSPVTFGDWSLRNLNLTGNRFASMAFGDQGSLTDSKVDKVHFGFSPFGIYAESSVTDTFIGKTNFYDSSCESCGNAAIYSASSTAGIKNTNFTGWATSWSDSRYVSSIGVPRIAAINVGKLNQVIIDCARGSTKNLQDAGPSVSVACCDYIYLQDGGSTIGLLNADGIINGINLKKQTTDVVTGNPCIARLIAGAATAVSYFTLQNGGGGALLYTSGSTLYDLVRYTGRDSCAPCTSTSTDQIAGVSLIGASGSETIPVQQEGYVGAVRCTGTVAALDTISPAAAYDGSVEKRSADAWGFCTTGGTDTNISVILNPRLSHNITLNSLTATADVSLSNHKLTNVATPTLSGDVATKSYVDSSLGTQPPREVQRLKAQGIVSENYRRENGTSAQIAANSTIYLLSLGILAGDVINNILFNCVIAGTVGSGKTRVAIVKIDGTILANSNDLAGTVFSSTSITPCALSSPYTVLSSEDTTGAVYAALLFEGWTTAPTLSRAGTAGTVGVGARVSSSYIYDWATGGTSKAITDLAVGAPNISISGSSNIPFSYWCGFN